MSTTTKTTADLVSGDRIIVPDTDARGWVLPVTPENPGTVVTVTTDAAPWIFRAGRYAGQVARRGRGNRDGAVVFAFTTDHPEFPERSADETYVWNLAR